MDVYPGYWNEDRHCQASEVEQGLDRANFEEGARAKSRDLHRALGRKERHEGCMCDGENSARDVVVWMGRHGDDSICTLFNRKPHP